jgi:hypothetical protein
MSFRSRRALGIRAPLCSALLVRIRLRSYIGYSTITTPLLLVSGDPGDPQYRTSSTKCDETHPPGRGSALNTIRLHPQDVIFTAGRPEKSTSNAVRILVGLPLLAATSMTNKGQPQCSANDCVSRRARLFLGRRGSRSAHQDRASFGAPVKKRANRASKQWRPGVPISHFRGEMAIARKLARACIPVGTLQTLSTGTAPNARGVQLRATLSSG